MQIGQYTPFTLYAVSGGIPKPILVPKFFDNPPSNVIGVGNNYIACTCSLTAPVQSPSEIPGTGLLDLSRPVYLHLPDPLDPLPIIGWTGCGVGLVLTKKLCSNWNYNSGGRKKC